MSEKQSIERKKMSENLSSETLFTFTGKIKYLISMLKDGILARYVYERLPTPKGTFYYFAPVKCFCDIPLGKVKSHLEWFGNYGLGINRAFLKEMGVTPIMYIQDNSNRIFELKNKSKAEKIEILRGNPLLPLLKRYYGDDYREIDSNKMESKRRKFYDEREWRYIPSNIEIEVGDSYRTIEEGIEYARKKNIDTPYLKDPIRLSPEHIEYIIIYDKDEFKKLREELRELYSDAETYETMLSKVLVAKQLLRDF